MRISRVLWPLLILSLAWPGAAAAAQTEEVTHQASGYGDSPETAIANALVEAARQALGVTVTLDPEFRRRTFEWVSGAQTTAGAWTSAPEARAPTLAAVAGYRVVATREVRDDLWQAEVEARLVRSKTPGPDRSALPTLVVAPVETGHGPYRPGEEVSGSELGRRLHQALVTAFTRSGRMRVLDREYPEALAREIRISQSGLSPLEHAKVGQQLGADFLVTTEVEEFRVGRETETFYGAQLNLMEPVVRIHYQLVDTATREIVDAGTWADERSSTVLLRKLREAGIEPEREPDRIGEVLYPDVARALSSQMLEVLYPLRVIGSDHPERIYLSQGDGQLELGDLLAVHPAGSPVTDPDTGITIRPEGPAIATLRIADVARDYARAVLLTGSPEDLEGELRLRRVMSVADAPDENDPPVTPGSSEEPLRW